MSKDSASTIFDTILLDQNGDIRIGFFLVIVGWLIAFVNSSFAILTGIGLGIYFTLAFLVGLLSGEQYYERRSTSRLASSGSRNKPYLGEQRAPSIPQTSSAPITDEPTIAERIKSIHLKNDFKCPSCGATVLPTDFRCKHCGSVLVASADLPKPEKWGDVEVGQSVQVKHPEKGAMSLSVQNRIYYSELWQTKMRPDVPWTLTGSYYVSLGLDDNILLMNWQSRFYLLDLRQPLTDMSINRDFAPHARKFAASNQTASVSFAFQGTMWRMDDIGRFRIEFAEGDGIKVSPGAVGRFIHARDMNNRNRILAVEDYQTGGSGLDTLWMGYQIEADDIKI